MIRAYNNNDKAKVIELLRLNTPEFFAPLEESDLIGYLENHAEYYFVLEDAQSVVGAGGINYGFDNGKTARISWDIIHPHKQGNGYGTLLTNFRIAEIKKNPAIEKIEVRTTQLVYKFYEKLGFQLEKIETDYWSKGFDLYLMKITLP
jgi:[ribosomal protein S18]-alanine N-acetyltransferase